MMISKKGTVSKSLLIGLLFLIIYITPFLHNKFEPLKKWSTYKEYYKKHDLILNKYILLSDNLIQDLKIEKINLEQFISQSEKNASNKRVELKEYFKGKKLLKQEFSFMGYTSFRIFLSEIGYKIFGLFSVILALFFLFNPKHVKEFKRLYLIATLGLLYVSSYWVLHSVLTKSDFKQWTYGVSFGVLSIISVVLITFFIYLFSKKENKLKFKIRTLISFITKSRGDTIVKLANKAIDNKNEKEILDIVNIHEDEMWETLEKTAE